MTNPVLSFNPESQDVLKEKDPIAEEQAQVTPSRTAAVANKVRSEWTIYSTARRPDEIKWLKYLRNFNGIYPPGVIFDEDSSDLFVQVTRKEVSKAIGKIKQINDPTLEEPWDIQPTDNPYNPLFGDEQAKYKAAAEAMRQRFKDNFETMNWDMIMDLSYLDYALFGTFVLHGPIGMPPPPAKWVQVPGKGNPGEANTGQQPKPSFVRVVDPDDAIRPIFERIRLIDFYPDPDAERIEDCNSVIIRQIYNQSQFREFLNDKKSFLVDEVKAVLEEMQNGNWQPTMLEREINVADEKRQPQSPSVTKRYEVLKRWGMLSGRDLQDIGMKVEDGDVTTEYMYCCWVVGNHVIRCVKSSFHKDRLPFYAVPYEKQPGKLFGRGVAEMIEDTQQALNSIGRAMMDNLSFGSGPQGMINIDAIPKGFNINKIGPRKMWPYRGNGEKGKPVDFFTVPTVLDQLIPAFKLFMDLIPQETSIPDFEPKSAGSGMRTDGSFMMYWEMAENFIKQTIGNISNYFWIPGLRKMYDWEMLYNPNMALKGDFSIVVRGPKGAVRREMVKSRLQEISQLMNNPMIGRRVDGAALAQGLLDHLDLGIEGVFLTEEQALQREQQQKMMEAQAAASGEAMKEESTANVRSEMSRRDALVKLATTVPPESPVWAPAIEQAYEILHAATPTLYAALSAHLIRVAAEAEAAGLNPKEVTALRMPPGPEAPDDLDPKIRDQFPMIQQQVQQVAHEGLQPQGVPQPEGMPVGDSQFAAPLPQKTRRHAIVPREDGGYELQVS